MHSFFSGKSKSSKTISGLAKGKYYFRVATYKTIGNARYISTFSKAKSTTVKSNLSIKQMLNAIRQIIRVPSRLRDIPTAVLIFLSIKQLMINLRLFTFGTLRTSKNTVGIA